MNLRPDLDGRSYYVKGRPEVWLLFHGMLHHLSNEIAHSALFEGGASHTEIQQVDDIARGADIDVGSCLARDPSTGTIFLVTSPKARVERKFAIPSIEVFDAFGFAYSRVFDVPPFILSAVPTGRNLRIGFAR